MLFNRLRRGLIDAFLRLLVRFRTERRHNLEQSNQYHLWDVHRSSDSPAEYEDLLPFELTRNDPTLLDRSDRFEPLNHIVAEVPSATITKPLGIAFTSSGKVVRESVSRPTVGDEHTVEQLRRTLKEYPGNMRCFHTQPDSPAVDCACCLYNPTDPYFHWIFDLLPKLRGVETFRQETDVQPKIIVSPDPPSFVYDSLELFGYRESDIIEWTSNTLRVNRLVVPTYPDMLPENINWLRESVLDTVADSGGFENERAFISRQKAAYRRVANYDDIIDLLSTYGFESYILEEMAFEDQVSLFNNAEAIVGPHGAGFSNIIWAEKPVVIELFNEYVTPTFTVLANRLGFDHEPLRCDPVNVRDSDADLVVDREALDGVLRRNL